MDTGFFDWKMVDVVVAGTSIICSCVCFRNTRVVIVQQLACCSDQKYIARESRDSPAQTIPEKYDASKQPKPKGR